jgi:arylsulfatase A
VLYGKNTQKKHDYLYWEFHEQGGKQAVRQGNWKAIRLKAAGNPDAPVELYDLSKDPGETKNVASEFAQKAKELGQIMNKAHVSSTIFPFASVVSN